MIGAQHPRSGLERAAVLIRRTLAAHAGEEADQRG